MNRLKSLIAGIPLLQDIRSAISLVVLVISLVLLLVVGFSLIRSVPSYRRLLSELATTQQALEEARRLQEQSPIQLRTQVAVAEATLDYEVGAFPSDEQGSGQFDDVYRYASEAGVQVSKLERLVNTPEENLETVYRTDRALIEAQGELRQLTEFIRLLTRSALPTFNLDNLKIVPAEELHVLTANVILYSSPLSSGVTVVPVVRETATPLDLAGLSEELDAAWKAGDWPTAISALLEMRAANPEDENSRGMLYWAYVNYGYALLVQGRRDEAITQFNYALSINPEGVEASDGLSEALETSMVWSVQTS